MRKTASVFLIFILLAQLGFAQSLDSCTITATVYKEDGTRLSGQAVIVHKVYKSGFLIRSVRTPYLTNASGVVTFTLPQGSVANIEAPIEGFKALGGQAVLIPTAATATLETLQKVTMPEQVAVAVPGVAVKVAGAAQGEFGTINFASGFSFTQSGGVANITATAGGGSLPWGGLTGSITDQVDLQNALNAKAALNHNHNADYEPKNVNIQAHIGRTDNPHVVTKAQVGLGNADNTADLAKPISTAMQTALDLKLDIGDAFSGSYDDLTDVPTSFAPSAHSASHKHGGSDEVASAIPAANAIPKAGAGGTIAAGWIPDLSATYQPFNSNIQAHIASTSNPHSVTKSQVGLGNVENTALSTWGGSANINTVGTVGTGVWQGTIIGPAYLGTGTRDGSKYLRDDGTWQPVSAGANTALSNLASVAINEHLLFGADNSKDIGASGATRPRSGYFGTSIFAPILRSPSGTTLDIHGGGSLDGQIRFKDGDGNTRMSLAMAAGDLNVIGGVSVGSTSIQLYGSGLSLDNQPITWRPSAFGSEDAGFKRVSAGIIRPTNGGSGYGRFEMADTVYVLAGSGSPEGAVTAKVGSIYQRTDGGAGTSFYIKESGTGNTGWTAVSSGGGGGSNPFADDTAIIKDHSDATKLVRVEAGNLTTGTTRVWTAPDANTTIPIISQVLTFTGPTAARSYGLPDSNQTLAGLGVANQVFTSALTIRHSDAFNTQPINVLYLDHWLSSGAVAAGMGAALGFRLPNDQDVNKHVGQVAVEWTDPTEESESADFVINLMHENTTYVGAGQFRVQSNGAVRMKEVADPSAPPSNTGVYFFRDNGSGKTQFCVRFPTGAVQVIATEP